MLSDVLEELGDLLVTGDITWIGRYIRSERRRQLFDVLLEPFSLIIKNQLRPC